MSTASVIITVPPQNKTFVASLQNKTFVVPPQDKTFTVPGR